MHVCNCAKGGSTTIRAHHRDCPAWSIVDQAIESGLCDSASPDPSRVGPTTPAWALRVAESILRELHDADEITVKTNVSWVAAIIARECPVGELAGAARALLTRIENITTDEFSKGGEKAEREALAAALAKLD
jgi:hypothetical protein